MSATIPGWPLHKAMKLSWRTDAPALVVTLLLACIAVAVYILERRTVDTYVHTTATVTTVNEGTDADNDTVYYPIATFMVGDDPVAVTYEGDGRKGQTIDVMYDPIDPHATAKRDRFLGNWWLTLIFVPASILSLLWLVLKSLTDSPSPGARTASRSDRPD